MTNAKRVNSAINRRTLLKGSILGGAAAIMNRLFAGTSRDVAFAEGSQAGASQSVIETTLGKVRGTRANGVAYFQGRSLRCLDRREKSLHAAR